MKKTLSFLPLAAAALMFNGGALAAQNAATCSVEINYSVNGAPVESYVNDFVVTRDEVYRDDRSTPTGQNVFTATLIRGADGAVISIDYFGDVSVFNAISVDTSLKLRNGGSIESTSGSHTFSSSQALPAGNHTTTHTLVCNAANR